MKAYFPQVLDWFRDKEAAVFDDFIERWPTLELAQRARGETLATFFRAPNVRYQTTIDRRIAAIREELSLTTDAAAIEPNRLLVEVLLPQLRAACAAIQRLDDEVGKLAPELPDHALFRALPGAGAALAPRLLVAFGERRERFPDAASLQKYAGLAPVTKRSGNKSSVHWRYRCPTFLRQTFIEWVGHTIPRSFWANAFYQGCRARGMKHQAALRALAFKWIRVLIAAGLTASTTTSLATCSPCSGAKRPCSRSPLRSRADCQFSLTVRLRVRVGQHQSYRPFRALVSGTS